ncbi:hypothetical protein [Nocardioides ferulae]|uniref:hypothetical protein n=1 Tax=Nocardioides ferulae TaxID=2340821 RepID=UPI000F88B511|nr:hypothetical protein [Nocardioides ferulae]
MAHPREPHRWDPRAPRPTGLVLPVAVDPTGRSGPTRAQAAGPRWRQSSRGLHVPATVSDDCVEQRILEQSQRLGPTGAVTGWAALRLLGGGFFDGLDTDGRTRLPVPLAAGGGRLEPHPAITRHRERLPESEVVVMHGIRTCSAERALFDEMRRLDLWGAVAAMDMAAAAELTSIRRMRAYCSRRTGARGRRHVLAALDLADEHSRSPAETRLRLVWELEGGWPRPLCNRPVFDLDGRLLGVPDLLDPTRGVYGEYDGAEHRTRERHRRDVQRRQDLDAAGLEQVTVVGADLRNPTLVVTRMRLAQERAAGREQRWTLQPPPGWRTEPSLDERLDLRDLLAEKPDDAE